MKTIQKKMAGISLLLMALSLTLFSFSAGKGGDSFEIYLNKSLVLKDHVYGSTGPKNISLQQGNYNDQLNISYLHCGQLGKNRNIILKDSHDKILKQWSFEDPSGKNTAMTCNVKDILALKKNNGGVLKLFYSSKELVNGQLLALIN